MAGRARFPRTKRSGRCGPPRPSRRRRAQDRSSRWVPRSRAEGTRHEPAEQGEPSPSRPKPCTSSGRRVIRMPENFTTRYGFIVDYLAEWLREMRKRSSADAINKYYRLGNNLNQRDVKAVQKTVSGFLKLLFPDDAYAKEDVRDCLEYALGARRRIKEQLKKIGGLEFYDVHFSYIDNETLEEHFVSLPEQGGASLIPEGPSQAGHVYTVSPGERGMIGVYRIELQTIPGTEKLVRTGVAGETSVRDAIN